MTFRLVIEPEARVEIAEVAVWYESQAEGLALRFLDGVERAFRVIEDAPYQYQVIRKRGGVRRAPIHGFPYGLIYVVLEQAVTVVTCVHGRRSPRRWQSQIP